jgi:hypothetical protein
MTVNLQAEIINSDNIQELNRLASELVGQTCWKVNFSYGDELMLHFGDRLSYFQPVMSNKEKGSWILGTRTTMWQIIHPDCAIVNGTLDAEILTDSVQILVGKKVSAVEIDPVNMNTSIEFDKLKLILLPEVGGNNDLPDWEIFRPDGMVLQGSRVWSLIRA